MIFRFVVRHLRWLGRIPFLPQCFDAFLLALTAVTAPRKLRAIQALEERVCDELGATTRPHRFGGVDFQLGPTELGHVHGNGLVDVLVGKKMREVLVESGRASRHHVLPCSGWISFWMRDETDTATALEFLRIASQRGTIVNK